MGEPPYKNERTQGGSTADPEDSVKQEVLGKGDLSKPWGETWSYKQATEKKQKGR